MRLLPTAARFDGVYASFFRCGRRLLRADYAHVNRWLREMLELTGADLFDLSAARQCPSITNSLSTSFSIWNNITIRI